MFIVLRPPSSQAPAGRDVLSGTLGHYAPLGLGTIAGTVRSINIVPLRGWAPEAGTPAGLTDPETRARSTLKQALQTRPREPWMRTR